MPAPIEDAHRSSWPYRNECFVEQEDKDVRCGRTPEVRDARRRGYRAAGRVEKGRLTLLILAPQIVTRVFGNTRVTIWAGGVKWWAMARPVGGDNPAKTLS